MWSNFCFCMTSRANIRKNYQIGTLHYNWPMSAHASRAFSTSTVPIRKICQILMRKSVGVSVLHCCPIATRLQLDNVSVWCEVRARTRCGDVSGLIRVFRGPIRTPFFASDIMQLPQLTHHCHQGTSPNNILK